MRIIVSDTSCLIDLQRGELIEVFLGLPHEFVLPDVLFDNELLSFSRKEKVLLRTRMSIKGLDGEEEDLQAAMAGLRKMDAVDLN
ncbi:MAG: hypothetical protein ACQESR_10210 [Planctomycetota bacterium]